MLQQVTRGNFALVAASEYESWVGRQAVWTLSLRRNSATAKVTTLVTVADWRAGYGRIDLLVRTNTGSTVWVTPDSLKLVPKFDD